VHSSKGGNAHTRRRPRSAPTASFTPTDEQMTQIIERLTRRYPREALVRNPCHEFDTVGVRTFVAVLTERLVRHHTALPYIPVFR
jgi:hypothetical protein